MTKNITLDAKIRTKPAGKAAVEENIQGILYGRGIDNVMIWIDKNNNVLFNDVKIKDTKTLSTMIYEKRVIDPQLIIALKVDQAAEMGYVIDVQQDGRLAAGTHRAVPALPGTQGDSP